MKLKERDFWRKNEISNYEKLNEGKKKKNDKRKKKHGWKQNVKKNVYSLLNKQDRNKQNLQEQSLTSLKSLNPG